VSSTPLILSREQVRLVLAVALFRRQHGRGPSWSELQEVLGLESRAAASFLIRNSFDCGVRWRRGEAHSLEVRPKTVKAALRLAREQREART
jgi:hypothetical protein